jgi:hypothetical protein
VNSVKNALHFESGDIKFNEDDYDYDDDDEYNEE